MVNILRKITESKILAVIRADSSEEAVWPEVNNKAPLPQLSIMPTGGVDLDNIDDWFKNGAEVVGVGSSLVKGSLDEIENSARKFI